MPPKKAPAKKLHELAPEVRVGFQIPDVSSKKTYVVGKQFATGGFGRIHTCTEEGKSHQMVMKIEPSTNGPLLTEVVVFNRILKQEHLEAYKKNKKTSWIGLPHLIANGYFQYNGDKMRYMIIPKYAMSLEAAREANGGTLSVKEALTVTNCVLDALEYLHSVDYAHADVKAANILLEKEGVYSSAVLVDFGLAHKTTNNADKPDKKRAHNGTCIFTSTDAHRGNNPSYRGDVEILAYNIVMWLTGTLPWLSLESSPDKVFDAKQKFINGLPGTLENVLQGAAAAAVGCLTTMFKMSMTTGYTNNVDMGKLRKLVTETIQKAPDAGKKSKKTTDVAGTSGPTPMKKKVGRPAKVDVSDGEEEEEVKPKKKVGRPPKTPKVVEDIDEKKTTTSRISSKPRKIVIDDEEDVEETEEIYTPKPTKSRRRMEDEDSNGFGFPREPEIEIPLSRQGASRTTTVTANSAAKKIEQKYKRMQMNKASQVPVTITISTSKSPNSPSSSSPSTSSGNGTKRSSADRFEVEEETIEMKTPALITPAMKKAKYKSGISSATKASPTELRRVPGVRNFPKGRRSMIIKETAAKYSERRARQQPRPTLDDSSCSGSSEV